MVARVRMRSPQENLLPQAPFPEAEALVTDAVLVKSVDCKSVASSELLSSSQIDKPRKAAKKSSAKSKTERARPHILTILTYFTFAWAFSTALVTGLTGCLHVVDRKMNENLAVINSVEDHRTLIHEKLELLTRRHLPLRFFENHAQCLIRGANLAHVHFLPHHCFNYPEVGLQTITWIEESCAKKFIPQAPRPQQQMFLFAAWKIWSQQVEDVVHVIKCRLGDARSWLLTKWDAKTLIQGSGPRNAADHASAPYFEEDYITNSPFVKLAACETARCRLIYVPGFQDFPAEALIQEPRHHAARKLEYLKEQQEFLHTMLQTVLSLCFVSSSLQLLAKLLLYRGKEARTAQQLEKNIAIPPTWTSIWINMDLPQKMGIGADALGIISSLIYVLLPLLGYPQMVCTFAVLIVSGFTCLIKPPISHDKLYTEVKALVSLSRERTIPKEESDNKLDQHTAEPGPVSVQVQHIFPRRCTPSPVSFHGDFSEEARFIRNSSFSPTTPTPTHTPDTTFEESLFEDAREEYKPGDDTSQHAEYEDVDLDSSDTDSDTGSDWSVVDDN